MTHKEKNHYKIEFPQKEKWIFYFLKKFRVIFVSF